MEKFNLVEQLSTGFFYIEQSQFSKKYLIRHKITHHVAQIRSDLKEAEMLMKEFDARRREQGYFIDERNSLFIVKSHYSKEKIAVVDTKKEAERIIKKLTK